MKDIDISFVKPNPMIEKWCDCGDQTITIAGWKYDVGSIITKARSLDVFNLSMKGINMAYESPCANSLSKFVTHMVATLAADLNYPIILSPTGVIMDGRHRLAKALLLGHKTIKAVQFSEWPDAVYVGDD